jgi:hypothetical protein
MNDRRDPSVPPRIGRVRGSRPARRIASRACSTNLRMMVENFLHVAVCSSTVTSTRAPGVRGHDLVRQALDQRFLVLERRGDEVAHQQLDRRAVHRSLKDVRVHESFVAVGRLRRHRAARQRFEKRRRQLDRVDHAALRVAGDAC